MTPASPRPGSDSPGRDLPAPYVSPWSLLRQDLVALLASLRLKLQELWRRNALGDLPRPGFWPDRLAAAFWPLLVALLLALLPAGISLRARLLVLPAKQGVTERPIAAADPSTAAIASAGSLLEAGGDRSMDLVASRQPTARAAWNEAHRGVDAAPPGRTGERDRTAVDGVPEQPSPPAPATSESLGRPLDARFAATPPSSFEVARQIDPRDAERHPASGLPMAGAELPVDELAQASIAATDPAEPLLRLLRATTPEAPPQAAGLDAGGSAVWVRTAAGFDGATPEVRQSWADRWLSLARQQGYDELTLIDPAGRMLGRQARVGSGMILLQPFSPPP